MMQIKSCLQPFPTKPDARFLFWSGDFVLNPSAVDVTFIVYMWRPTIVEAVSESANVETTTKEVTLVFLTVQTLAAKLNSIVLFSKSITILHFEASVAS